VVPHRRLPLPGDDVRLLADCGNSSIKLALAHAGGIWTHARVEPTPAGIQAFAATHLAALDELISLPTSSRHAETLHRWWREATPKPLRILGEDLALPQLGQYPTCGGDRVLAGLVAVAQEACALVVVDAGTATTVTAWQQAASQQAGFAGGVILPGAAACSIGLAQLAPALPVVEPSSCLVTSLQQDTRGALAAGLGIGYPALVAALRDRVCRDAGISRSLVTGGNATALLEAGVFSRLDYRPTLVLEGIEAWCRRALA
jgi:pantothenate kinase type III